MKFRFLPWIWARCRAISITVFLVFFQPGLRQAEADEAKRLKLDRGSGVLVIGDIMNQHLGGARFPHPPYYYMLRLDEKLLLYSPTICYYYTLLLLLLRLLLLLLPLLLLLLPTSY